MGCGITLRTEARAGAADAEAADRYFREAAALTTKMLAALPDNRTLLDHIRRHGMPRI
jgi:tryptophan halogenase